MNITTNKQEELKKLFTSCASPEARYELIIALGKKLPPMNPAHKISENLVDGCQSKLYLHTTFQNNILHFEVDSDALISKGLAALLFHLYNNESPEFLLKNPPTILNELNILASLSMGRANGLKSLYVKMQKFALQQIVH